MGIFDKIFKKDVKGYIRYYNLEDWWILTFTDKEKEYIINTYKPMGASLGGEIKILGEVLIKGNIDFSSHSKLLFLVFLSGWFSSNKSISIALKIIQKIESIIIENGNNNDPLDEYFAYGAMIDIYYRLRDSEKMYFEKAMDACKNQIRISLKSKEAFLKEYKDSPLPRPIGFQQLAIIYEKSKNYDLAIETSKIALEQGWAGDWTKRIERCELKLKN
jgi:hypothetical protein